MQLEKKSCQVYNFAYSVFHLSLFLNHYPRLIQFHLLSLKSVLHHPLHAWFVVDLFLIVHHSIILFNNMQTTKVLSEDLLIMFYTGQIT